MLVAQIFYPVAFASVVYGPETFEGGVSGQSTFGRNFNVDNASDFYRLYVRSMGNASDNLSVFLNGLEVLTGEDFSGSIASLDVNLSSSNLLQVLLNGSRSSYTAWIENGTPGIKILTPTTDTVSNGPVMLSGLVQDLNNTYPISIENTSGTEYSVPGPREVTISLNGVDSTVDAEGGYFSTMLNLSAVNSIVVSFTDVTGTLRMADLQLDGDYLNQSEESALGFDPLSPDSDSSLTVVDESDNGVLDGLETFGGDVNSTLPVFVKSRVGADPFKNDTDDDGLPDFYEVMKLIPFTSPASSDTDNDGIPDGLEDVDNDTLTNLQELQYGTSPLNEDSDGDGLDDCIEIQFGSNPLAKDSDGDGLQDDSEYRLGTLPDNQDTDNDSVPDGREVYTSTKTDDESGVTVTVTGVGDAARNISLFNETSQFFLSHPALISRVVNVSVSANDEATIGFNLDEENVSLYGYPVDPSVMMVCHFNETLGMYLPLDTSVEVFDEVPERYTVSTSVVESGLYGCFNASNYSETFLSIVESNYGTCNVNNTVNVSLNGNVNITVVQGEQEGMMLMSSLAGGDLGLDSMYEGGSTSNFNVLQAPRQLSQPEVPGYQYVKTHIINGSSDGALSDYQVKLVIHRGSGVDSGADVYLNGHSQSWPYDTRFADSSNNMLSYWLQSYDANVSTVWVKVPSIPARPGNATIKLYYGKSGDPGASNGIDTFPILFDDFNSVNTGLWSGNYSCNNGIATISQANLISQSSYGCNVLMARMASDGSGTSSSKRLFHWPPGWYDNDASIVISFNINGYSPRLHSANGREYWGSSITWSPQTYYNVEIGRLTGSTYIAIDGVGKWGITSPPTTPGKILFEAGYSGSTLYSDWICIRKGTANSPTDSAWSNETTTLLLPNPAPSEFEQDTDNDGLPDHVEQEGFLDDRGVLHRTNVSSQDTDNDGLLDNEEVQYVAISGYNSGSYKMISYPDEEDSDGDTLWDEEEYYLGTKPLLVDSDGDGLNDDIDPNPLTFDAPLAGPDVLQVVGIILKGAVLGDVGDESGWLHFLVGEDADSPFYVLGVILGGFIPISDLRDLLQSIVNLDALGSLLNAIGFIPLVGDGAKIVSTIGIYLAKHIGDLKYILDLTHVISENLLKDMPDFISVPVFAKLTNEGSTRLITNLDLDDTALLKKLAVKKVNIEELSVYVENMAEAGSDPQAIKELVESVADGTRKASLNKAFWTIKSDTGNVRLIWLEEGGLDQVTKESTTWTYDLHGRGWTHIEHNHFDNPDGNQFLQYGPQYANKENVKKLLLDASKYGEEKIVDNDYWRVYSVPNTDNRKISVLVGDNGFIVTTEPREVI